MASIKQALLTIRSGGLPHVLNILRYTLYKSRLDRRHRRPSSLVAPVLPGYLKSFSEQGSKFSIHFEQAHLEIEFQADNLVRIDWSPGKPVPAYALTSSNWPGTPIVTESDPAGFTLISPGLWVRVGMSGEISFLDSDGKLLRQDEPPVFQGEHLSLRTRVEPGSLFCGLGAQAGPFNLLERSHGLWNSDPGGNYGPGHDPLYMPVPVYYVLHDAGSYLVFYENSYQGKLSASLADEPSHCEISFEGGSLRYYFIPGAPARAVQAYSQLTGRSPLPPVWSLGYHQSRWGYRTADDIRTVLQGFQSRDLPISAIHLDIDYMDNGRAFTFNPGQFPSVKELTDELHEAGIRLVTIVDPGVKIDLNYDIYRSGIQGGHFASEPGGKPVAGMLWLGRCCYPDFTNPATRDWWGRFYTRLLNLGVDGIWHDMNEPTSFVAWGDLTLPDSTCHDLDGMPGDHRQAHNLYGMQMNRSAWEALVRDAPARRPWILSRSGWAGSQRFAWNWTADTECTWECLRMNLISILGLAVSGFAYSGPDIGGFMGNPSAELYLRWFQMAAFLPFFRTHSAVGTDPREPWVYGEPYTSIIRKFLHLRYSLLPYIYTLAWRQSMDGAPMVRPLFWEDASDPLLRKCDNAFFLGEAMLIAPIMEENCQSREIIFPTGQWYNFWDGSLMDTVSHPVLHCPAHLEDIPVFIRSGSILPMTVTGHLTLHVYLPKEWVSPAKDATPAGILYSDVGDGYGDYRVDSFHLSEMTGGFEILWKTEGAYPLPFQSIQIVVHGHQIDQVVRDDQVLEITQNCLETGPFMHLKLVTKAVISK